MSKEERLNTFPESMKPNLNADIVFWENSKSNEYGDANIDEDMGSPSAVYSSPDFL